MGTRELKSVYGTQSEFNFEVWREYEQRYIYLQIQFHTQLLPATRTHTDTQVSGPALTLLHTYYSETTHSCTAPPYLAAWMRGTACIYIFSSDVCAFSYPRRAQVPGVILEQRTIGVAYRTLV